VKIFELQTVFNHHFSPRTRRMLRLNRYSRSIMERYRKIRPIDLEAPPKSTGISIPDPLKSKTYIPPSYIRSPVPVAVKTFLQPSAPSVQQPREPRRLRVALIGAPNAGKTSLLNQLLDVPLGAVSCKKNTTRESIVGVLTRENFQFEFVDCPGIVPLDGTDESRTLSAEAWKNYGDCDCALLVVDTVKKPDLDFLKILRKLTPKKNIADEWNEYRGSESRVVQHTPVILVLNKSDLVQDWKWMKVRQNQLSAVGDFDNCFFVSATENKGLDKLVDYLKTKSTSGKWMYPSDAVTTLPKTAQIEQLIRSLLFTWFNKDVPYKIEQQTVGWTERLDGSLVIEHELIVKDSVVARMILGTKNRLLTRLRENVVYKLKKNWNMENISLLIYVKARAQRKSKRDTIDESKRESSHLFYSRGSG